MTSTPSARALALAVCAAAALWFFSFFVAWGSFWAKIAVSSASLAALAAFFGEKPGEWLDFTAKDLILGLFSAAALYLLFFAGNEASRFFLPFAESQVAGLYARAQGPGPLVTAPLLLFVTGPCEEIFWRGFIQKNLAKKIGPARGILLATALYTATNLSARNFMLVGAAVAAGLFWGFMYAKTGRITAVMVSHSLWGLAVFILFPIK